MIEYPLLLLVGKVVSVVVKGGYVLAGSYFVRTGIRYISDYKESVAKENA